MKTKPYFVYMTTPTREMASTIGRALVENHMAACVNIIDGMTSIYRWEGKIEEDGETILVAKTVQDQLDDLKNVVESMHPAKTPCIVAWPIENGSESYLNWLALETAAF